MTAEKVPGRALNLPAGVMCFSLNQYLWPKDRMLSGTRSESHGDPVVEAKREEGITYCYSTWAEAKIRGNSAKENYEAKKNITAIQVQM